MLSLEKAKKYPRIFLHLTGISLETFKDLMVVLKREYPKFEKEKVIKERKRAIGTSGKFKLSIEESVYDFVFPSPLPYL